MTDIIPDNSNRLAYLLGLIFHPFVVAIVTLLIVLQDFSMGEAFTWTAVIGLVLIIPLMVAIRYQRRQERYTYQRQSRSPLYAVGWVSVAVALALTILFDAPHVLRACLASLLVWAPLQAWINARYTKVSTHVAVVTGCVTGVLFLGHLDTPLLLIAAPGVIALTAWARIITRNHTPLQVILGVFTGAIPVLVTFPVLVG